MPFTTDRKSTRLNSSHLVISYAVFCLKKKKKKTTKNTSTIIAETKRRHIGRLAYVTHAESHRCCLSVRCCSWCFFFFFFFFFLMMRRPPKSPLFPYTPLFR